MNVSAVPAKKVRIGDLLAHPSVAGLTVTDVVTSGNQTVIYARSGRREFQLELRSDQKVDVAR